jgi:hypothetical protein
MSRIVVDATLHEKLARILHPVELCDADGHVLGRYIPDLSLYDLEPGVSEEELRRREQAGGGRTLKGILSDLMSQG